MQPLQPFNAGGFEKTLSRKPWQLSQASALSRESSLRKKASGLDLRFAIRCFCCWFGFLLKCLLFNRFGVGFEGVYLRRDIFFKSFSLLERIQADISWCGALCLSKETEGRS